MGRRRYGIEKGDRNRIAGLYHLDDYIGRLISADAKPAGELFRKKTLCI
ncbi:hypothetical protein KJ656_10710 [bacterium]|nr:hypothetical protein [bacterium]